MAGEKLKKTTTDYTEGQVGRCWEFFNTPISEGDTWEDRFMYSEDYYFSQRWRDAGGEVIMDPSIKLIHHGSKAYGLE